jgi:hypothetical protein
MHSTHRPAIHGLGWMPMPRGWELSPTAASPLGRATAHETAWSDVAGLEHQRGKLTGQTARERRRTHAAREQEGDRQREREMPEGGGNDACASPDRRLLSTLPEDPLTNTARALRRRQKWRHVDRAVDECCSAGDGAGGARGRARN